VAGLHWIEIGPPGRIATAARPRAGDWLEDELRSWKGEGANVVVSLLERDETVELELGGEAAVCQALGLTFINMGVPDMGVPIEMGETRRLVSDLAARVRRGEALVVHCRGGLGRSSTIAAAILKHLGISPHDAFERISKARGFRVPETPEQIAWVEAYPVAA